MRTLYRRLSVLPPGLEPLYQRMLEQIDPFYHMRAAQIFCIVDVAVKPLSPLALSFADDSPRDALSHQGTLSKREILHRHSQVEKRLKARTAGLIEINSTRHKVDGLGSSGYIGDYASSTSESGNRRHIEPSSVQYLHLTVKEFLRSAMVPTWLAAQTPEATVGAHVDIIACCLRQFRATKSLSAYQYTEKQSVIRVSAYHETVTSGLVFMIMYHARQAETISKEALLAYLEVLDSSIVARDSRLKSEFQGHWTTFRYLDWLEPEWGSDYVSYLVTTGMTQSVIETFNRGYRPSKKLGRPLLLYAICESGPDYSIHDDRRNVINLVIVEELLIKGCDPNQSFEELHVGSIFSQGFGLTLTVWQCVLLRLLEVRNFDLATAETDERKHFNLGQSRSRSTPTY